MARDPVGRWVSGDGFVHFCASPHLWGLVLWGRPSMATALAAGRTLPIELRPDIAPHGSLVDARRLAGADSAAFEALAWYLSHHAEQLATQVLALAVVRPRGLQGALVAGTPEVLRYPYPVEVFREVGPALGWLEAHTGPGRALLHEAAIDALHAVATRSSPLVTALEALIAEDLTRPPGTVEAARRLGTSERTLQRKLSEAGTSYHGEIRRARIRAAQQLMLEGDSALTAIAFDVGCSSLQRFSALFRRTTGESPSAWRERRRR
jgi:AraC-like DNA-binding protein